MFSLGPAGRGWEPGGGEEVGGAIGRAKKDNVAIRKQAEPVKERVDFSGGLVNHTHDCAPLLRQVAYVLHHIICGRRIEACGGGPMRWG